jgi:hypothetical protein
MTALAMIVAFVFIVWCPDESYALSEIVCP